MMRSRVNLVRKGGTAKIQNLKISRQERNLSLSLSFEEKLGLETLKHSLLFFFLSFLFFSFFLSFFLQINSLKNYFTKEEREMVDDAMDADEGGETALGGGAGGGAAASTTTTTAKRKIEVKKWNAVAVWSWSTSFDSCAICRNTLHEPSIEFQANSQQEGADGLSIAVRFYIVVVLLSFALSRSAFSNAFVFD